MMRDKLIELIDSNKACDFEWDCGECKYYDKTPCFGERLADVLIANGVTFADVPETNVGKCDYCQEDKDGYRAMFGAFSIHSPFHGSTWEIATGHCKPRQIYFCPMCGRKLSEPPKEDE